MKKTEEDQKVDIQMSETQNNNNENLQEDQLNVVDIENEEISTADKLKPDTHRYRIKLGFKENNMKFSYLGFDRYRLVSKALTHTNFYVKKSKIKNFYNYLLIEVQKAQPREYVLPPKEVDENYKKILEHFKDKENEKANSSVKDGKIKSENGIQYMGNTRELYKMTFKPNFPQNTKYQDISLNDFIQLYSSRPIFLEMVFECIIKCPEYFVFLLKQQLIHISFSKSCNNLLFAGYTLYLIELDNFNNSIYDNLEELTFKLKYQYSNTLEDEEEEGIISYSDTYDDLKLFLKILSSGNVLFENLRRIKLSISKDPNTKVNFNHYQKCKEIKKKIYRQLLTQNIINNFDENFQNDQDEQNIENEGKNDIPLISQDEQGITIDDKLSTELQKVNKIMTKITKKHLLMCQNEKLYKQIKKDKLMEKIKTQNNYPNFEDYNITSIFTITNSKQYVDDLLLSTSFFIKQFFSISFQVFLWTFIGALIPLKVFYHEIKSVNQYFNAGLNVKNIYYFIPYLIKKIIKQLVIQGVMCAVFILILINLIKFNELKFTSQNITILFICYWIYQILIYTILRMAQLVNQFFVTINIYTEDMYDINEYQISQKTYYLEFLQNIEDTYMRNILPVIPKQDETMEKLGITIGKNLKNSSKVNSIGKNWVSTQMISARYIAEKERIASKDPEEIVEQIYFIGNKQSYFAEFFRKFQFYFLVIIRAIGIPLAVHFFHEKYENYSILLMIIVQSILVYTLNLIPSGFQILQGQSFKLLQLRRVINMITLKEIKYSVREIPIINLFDITSLESWHNLSRITYARTRRIDHINDVAISMHGVAIIIMLIFIILDIFGAFWEKYSLFNPKFIFYFAFDALVILFIAVRSLWFKVQMNKTYDIIIEELSDIIGQITDLSRNLPEMLVLLQEVDSEDEDIALEKKNQKKYGKFDKTVYDQQSQQFKLVDDEFDDEGQGVQDLLIKVGLFQLRRQAQLRLKLENQNLEQVQNPEKALRKATYKYANNLLEKYYQIKQEFEHESLIKAEMFLGLVKVDDKLVKQIAVAAIVAGVTSSLQVIMSWLNNASGK